MLRTILAPNLVLRDDDLGTVRIVGARDGVLENANSPDDLAFLNNADLATFQGLARAEVTGVTNDLLGLYCFFTTPYANEFAIGISDNLVDRLVEHVGASVDGTESSKGLWELSKAIQRVDVGRFAITGHGRRVENDAVVGIPCRLCDVTVKLHLIL